MIRTLVIAVSIGLVSKAEGGIVRIQFDNGTNAYTGSVATVEFYYDLAPGEVVSAVVGGFQELRDDPLAITGYVAHSGHASALLGVLGPGSVVGSFWGGGQEPLGPQSLHLGSVVISPTTSAVQGESYWIIFDHGLIGVYDPVGQASIFDTFGDGSEPGYWTYGSYGGPEQHTKKYHIPPDPLTFTYVPEPVGSLLLGLGAWAVLRRR